MLDQPAVGTLLVVEALPEVIEWHRRGLVPLGAGLTSDRRCEFVNADFFALAGSEGMDPATPGRRYDAILVDIDHSPRAVLHPAHGSFYTAPGLRRVAAHLKPHGVFGLWSNDPPDEDFRSELAAAFALVDVHVVRFRNPLQDRDASNTVYLGRARAGG